MKRAVLVPILVAGLSALFHAIHAHFHYPGTHALAAGSPAIGAGVAGVTYLVTTDHELATRGHSSVDVGAFGH